MKMGKVLLPLVVAALAVAAYAADDKSAPRNDGAKNAAFEQFKQLAGEWVGKEGGPGGMPIHVKYKVTSGGSAVVETISPDTEHEMVTVIHPDGDELVLTHYCMLGNQPQMRAPAKANGNSVAFKFKSATNLKSDKDMHMHDVTFTFVDKDTLKTEWVNFNNGKPEEHAVFELKRKK
jgi:hypothetical protein